MLLSFRVANYRSIRGDWTLSFVAADLNAAIVRHTGVESDGKEIAVIPAVAMFGANASGKTNFLRALDTMRSAVCDSVARWGCQHGVPRDPFALDPACRDDTTLFEVELLLGSVRYTYGFELSDDRVEAEWLHAYPDGRQQVWFDREADRTDGQEFSFPHKAVPQVNDLVEFTRPNALFLTVAATLNNAELGVVHRWFRDSIRTITSGDNAATHSSRLLRELLVDTRNGEAYRRRLESLLRAADVGIEAILVDCSVPLEQQITLLHRSDGAPRPLNYMTQESRGTHALIATFASILDALDSGSLLLIDELDSRLHPVLTAEIVNLFNDPRTNSRDAQLLFTSHDTTLLGKGLLGRPLSSDQVWITTKSKTGATELYPLTDACPTETDDLQFRYLRGHYGGIPRVMAGETARTVSRS